MVISEFSRVLSPGGILLLAGQILGSGDDADWLTYDHQASPAYRWRLDVLAELTCGQGFTEIARLHVHESPQNRVPAGYLLLRKLA
ncbi:hypothetical protein [Williamsia sterculiae]|uniref:hypothetical protein n=1 Tax=Williamsia sterculiae TaxID=1344003 RepID=UPI00117F9B12|nr:hypothetical protein [Williamsia sterculiae]